MKKIDELIARAREQRRKEEFPEALATIEEALRVAEELPEDQRRLKKGEIYDMKGRILYWIGKSTRDPKKIEKAFEVNEIAIELRESDPIGYGYSMWQCFMYAHELGKKINIEEIRKSQEKARQLAINTKDIQRVGDFSQNLAFLAQTEGEAEENPEEKRSKFERAIEEYTTLLLIRQLAADERGKAMSLDRRAECYIKMAELDLKDASKIYEKRGDKEGLKRIEERKKILS